MAISRRDFFRAVVPAVASPAVLRTAWAQAYPARPLRIIVPLPPGGAADIVTRIMARRLERLGQPVVIENKPGAGTTIGIQAVVNAPPDGHTLLMFGNASAISASLYERLPFNFLNDIVPVAGLVTYPLVMEVSRSFPASTVAEFIAYAKANPGRINMASAGIGTVPHLAGEMFKSMTDVNMVHVPYRGEPPAITDILAGHAQVMFGNVTASIAHIQSGALRALAVTTAAPSNALPNVPTVGDTVPGYEATGWFGVGVPRNTSRQIVELLNREINVGLADRETRARYVELGSTPLPLTPADFGSHVASETEKWAKIVRASGTKPS